MKNLFTTAKALIASSMLILVAGVSSCCGTGSSSSSNAGSYTIKTEVPKRAAGQEHVVGLTAEPLETVRVAVIGLGMRGPGAVHALANIEGVEVVALCDVRESSVKSANKIVTGAGHKPAQEFYGDTAIWRQVTALPDLDVVYIATDWKNHTPMAVQAMKDGKHAVIEVPSAMTLEEIWDLINTSEQTRKHCIQIENCVYDDFELTCLNMAQQGVFGEVMHGEGAYIHQLKDFWTYYYEDWRLAYNREHRGDVYATHGMGPICQVMNIHRGDKLNTLVSMDTDAHIGRATASEVYGEEVTDFANGDHTMTMIRTENGKTIQIQHDVMSPRPYSRAYQVSGDKGFANKYPNYGLALSSDAFEGVVIESDGKGKGAPNIENLNAHSYLPEPAKAAIMAKYQPRILKEIGEKAKQMGGHGGMDFVMIYRLIYCLQNGLPLDMDVYDLAEWCCLAPLSALSIENGSAPVEVPDFTRGHWNEVDGYRHAFVD